MEKKAIKSKKRSRQETSPTISQVLACKFSNVYWYKEYALASNHGNAKSPPSKQITSIYRPWLFHCHVCMLEGVSLYDCIGCIYLCCTVYVYYTYLSSLKWDVFFVCVRFPGHLLCRIGWVINTCCVGCFPQHGPLSVTPQQVEVSPKDAPTTPPPKKTLLQQHVASANGKQIVAQDSGEKKRRQHNLDGDNVKRMVCDICGEPRKPCQRGAVCDICMRYFRKETGHQSYLKCKGDTDLIKRVAAKSKALKKKDPEPKRPQTRSFGARLTHIEGMLQKVLDHLDVKWKSRCGTLCWGEGSAEIPASSQKSEKGAQFLITDSIVLVPA